MNSFKSGAGADYVHRQLVLEVWGFNQREKGGLPEAASHEEGNLYSLEDLEAYKNDPRHKAVSALCKSIREDRVAVDYEFQEA